MNRLHRWLCASALWRRALEERVIPWALDGVDLGRRVLEIGPGPGLTTDLLRHRVDELTCVEIDSELARRLQRRLTGSNVRVLRGDATSLTLADASFDAVVSLTMLHHVPSPALQDRVLAEAARVLRPGGVLVGVDTLPGVLMRAIHLGDVMVPVSPDTVPERLAAAGFRAIAVVTRRHDFKFTAVRR